MTAQKTKEEILKEMDLELKAAILRDSFSEQSKFSQFLRTYIPPFKTQQKEMDINDCNKSSMLALFFNQKKLAQGVDPINMTPETFGSCKRLQKSGW